MSHHLITTWGALVDMQYRPLLRGPPNDREVNSSVAGLALTEIPDDLQFWMARIRSVRKWMNLNFSRTDDQSDLPRIASPRLGDERT